jgi:lysophospholipase L1-like esterase
MKKRYYVVLPILLILIPVSSYYLYRSLKTRYEMNKYFRQGDWVDHRNDFAKFKKRDHLSILFGDSMTENFWPYMVKSDSILNMGISGDFTEGLIMRIDDVIRLKPDNLFIMIGINDIVEKVPLKEIKFNYKKIVELVRSDSPDTKIYIQSTLPTRDLESLLSSSTSVNKSVIELNDYLKLMSKDQGLTFIDMYASFIDEHNNLKSELTWDGIHLNQQGYMIWKNYLAPYLKF